MNTTLNYNLKKREPGDNVKNDLLVISPENLDAIDAQMKVSADAISALTLKVSILTLQADIDNASKTLEGVTIGSDVNEFTQTSVDTFAINIATAQTVVDNSETKTQIEMDTAILALKADKTAFLLAMIPEGNPVVLTENIASAQTLHDEATEGEYNEQYTVGSKAILQSAIDTAQLVLDDELLDTQEDLGNAISELTIAVNTFELSVVSVDSTVLVADILSAQTIHDGVTEGELDGQHVIGSKAILQTAIDDAQSSIDNYATRTQEQIDIAVSALSTSITAFNASVVVVSVTSLNDDIATATQLLVDHVEGLDPGQTTAEARTDLQAAIDAAQLISDDSINKTQSELDTAESQLETDITTFNATIIA